RACRSSASRSCCSTEGGEGNRSFRKDPTLSHAIQPADQPPSRSRWRFTVWSAVVFLVLWPCVGLPLCCVSYPTILEWSNRTPFDSAGWKASTDREVRYDMSWDLRHRGVLKKKSPAEVEELLGRPDTTDVITRGGLPKFNARGVEPGTEVWYYSLGGEKYAPGI